MYLTASQYLEFPDEISSDIYECEFWYSMIKHDNV